MAKGALKNTLNMNYSAEQSFIDAYKPDENSLTKTERMDSPVAQKKTPKSSDEKQKRHLINFIVDAESKAKLKAYADSKRRSVSSILQEFIDNL